MNPDRTIRLSARTCARLLLVGAAWRALWARGLRSSLTVVGIAIGIAAGVATAGATLTASANLGDRFDAYAATLVTARLAPTDAAGATAPTEADLARAASIDGVEDVAAYAAPTTQLRVSRTRTGPGSESDSGDLRLVAASPRIGEVLRARLLAGRWFDRGHEHRGDAVVVLDTVAAERLGLSPHTAPGRDVFVDGRYHAVLGVVEAPDGDPRLLGSLVVPPGAPARHLPEVAVVEWEVIARTRLGAAGIVGTQLPVALSPTGPERATILIPADLSELKAGVATDTQALFYGLALVSLLVAGVGTGNTLVVSVMERRAEIGLRRALGASRRAVAAQFLVEGGLLGLVGGLLGTLVGLALSIGIAAARGWVLVVEPWVLAAGPACGSVIAVIAALAPASMAARTQPAQALRS